MPSGATPIADVARNKSEVHAIKNMNRLIKAIEADCWKEMKCPFSREVPTKLKHLLEDYNNGVNGFLSFEDTDPSTHFPLNAEALLERGILSVVNWGDPNLPWSSVMIKHFSNDFIPQYELNTPLYAFRSFCRRVSCSAAERHEKQAARMLYYGIIHTLLLQEKEGRRMKCVFYTIYA